MRLCASIAIAFLLVAGTAVSALAEELTQAAAVQLAEKFIRENGYTDRPQDQSKAKLDPDFPEISNSRDDWLAARFNTLKSKAIGAKAGGHGHSPGWSVAFDYVPPRGSRDTCRVVTMKKDGSEIRIEHKDGLRSYFVGF